MTDHTINPKPCGRIPCPFGTKLNFFADDTGNIFVSFSGIGRLCGYNMHVGVTTGVNPRTGKGGIFLNITNAHDIKIYRLNNYRRTYVISAEDVDTLIANFAASPLPPIGRGTPEIAAAKRKRAAESLTWWRDIAPSYVAHLRAMTLNSKGLPNPNPNPNTPCNLTPADFIFIISQSDRLAQTGMDWQTAIKTAISLRENDNRANYNEFRKFVDFLLSK